MVRLLLVLLLCVGALAQETPTPVSPELPEESEVQASLEQVQQEVEFQTRALEKLSGPPAEAAKTRLGRFKDLQLVLERHLGTFARNTALEEEREEVSRDQAVFRQTGLEGPFDMGRYDRFLDQLDAQEERLATAQIAVGEAEQNVVIARDRLSTAEAGLRALRDSAPAEVPGAEERVQLLRARLALARQEQRLAKGVVEVERTRLSLLTTQKDWLQRRVTFSKKDLDSKLASVEEDLERLQTALAEARDAAERASTQEAELGSDPDPARAALALARSRQTQVRVETLSERISAKDLEKDIWKLRYQVWHTASQDELKEWNQRGTLYLEGVRRAGKLVEARRDALRRSILNVRQELDDASLNSEERELWRRNLEILRTSDEVLEQALQAQIQQQRLVARGLAELEARQASPSLLSQAGDLWKQVSAIWDFELFVIGERGVTVSKVVVALVILVVGLILAKQMVRLLRARVLDRLKIRANVLDAVEKFTLYFVNFLVILFALHVVNIPLTIFTFLGGTVAIAVGFGAQTVSNNFISGLILTVEQPIKVGDIIETAGTLGTVEEVGARSTRLLTFDGYHAIIPNSILLEQKLTNWTLKNNHVRSVIAIGVAYGSPTREVEKLLLEAVNSVENVEPNPVPVVYFQDFAESSLLFRVYFWVPSVSVRFRVESEVRHTIDKIFRERDIEISFPQHDVHLDTRRPLEVTLKSQV